eukprot:Phypoly_transcript_19517.p1 GENE.Phypoly_transcript_19517~~Phypoly_transcript_19517.p1  ORF type:complete len:229 (+),score=44.73 Phypoly_transcript_19517:21-707(+)
MPATLYGIILSSNVTRALIVAKHLGIPLNIHHVDITTGEQKKEDFLVLNPFGKIPAYVSEDEKFSLFESRAIARYLDLTTGGKLLKISDPHLYGKVEAWASAEANTFSKQAGVLYVEIIVKPLFFKKASDRAVVDATKPEFIKTLEVYEKHFATEKTSFLVSNEVTIADLFHYPLLVSVALKAIPDILTPYPHVKAWLDRLLALPASQELQAEVKPAYEKLLQSQTQH